jgi:hypothetical protein
MHTHPPPKWAFIFVLFFRDAKCATELNGWNIDFENSLVQYSARVLPDEAIFQKDHVRVSQLNAIHSETDP